MAPLDPETPAASMTDLEGSRLLRLDREPFYKLVRGQFEIARGMIRVLTGRLRKRLRDLKQLRREVERSA